MFKVTFAAGAVCGDGTVDAGEACDDGNTTPGDGCDANCQLESVCGDGVVDPGEDCDDGNTSNTDGCLNTCVSASCGDGFVRAGVEACDDGNASNADACLSTCEVAGCGDAFVQAGVESCDDGNTVTETTCDYGTPTCTACSADCYTSLNLVGGYCGDGFVQVGVEECDDGNTNNNDGCLDTCIIPTGTGPFVEQSGLLVMEAEHYAALASDGTTNDTWSEISVGTASGGMCMQVGPDSDDYHTQQSDVEANAARMDYEVEFATTGAWYIWVRGASTTSRGWASDSCHGGIDGAAQALYLDYGSSGAYEWVRGTVSVGWPGLHTVNVFMREDGFIADKVLLTTDAGYTPSGISQPESPRL